MKQKLVNLIKKVENKGVGGTIRYYSVKRKKKQDILKEIQNYHLIGEEERERQRNTVFPYSPCISLITPLYNTPEKYLRQLLDSVCRQTYTNWEFCLADGSDSQHLYVERICREYAKDKRIVYKKLQNNEGIVGNTNQAVEMASGEYYGLLDHDDILHESALFECVREVQKGADFIYTDEMRFKKKVEKSTDVICKSGFGKDELRSHNYICHFVVFKKTLLDGMKTLYRRECEGSQDYDMVLRLTERAGKIVHIPRILYYWRAHKGSVAMNLAVKQYAVDSAKRAIADQLARTGEKGEVFCNLPYQTIYRIQYEIEAEPVVSICIWEEDSKLQESYIQQLIRKTQYRPLEIITSSVCGCQSDDLIIFRCFPRQNGESLYMWLNRIREELRGEYLVLMNAYCIPAYNSWIHEMLMYAQRRDTGVIGVQIVDQDHKIYFGGGVLDLDGSQMLHVVNCGLNEEDQGYEANMRLVRNTTFASALCMMISTKTLDEFGWFDVDTGDCGDIDFSLRCRKNGRWNVWNCFAKIYYTGHRKIGDYWKDSSIIKNKWLKEGTEENFYHPLLKKLRKM